MKILLCTLQYLAGKFSNLHEINLSFHRISFKDFETNVKLKKGKHVLVSMCGKGTNLLLSNHKNFLNESNIQLQEAMQTNIHVISYFEGLVLTLLYKN